MRIWNCGVMVAVLGVLALVGVRAEASEPMKAIVASYLDMQQQLAGDKIDTVKAQAHAIGEQAAKLRTDRRRRQRISKQKAEQE